MSISVVVGNTKPRSRTYHAATLVAERLTDAPPDLVLDLVDFGAALVDWSNADVAAAVGEVQASSVVVFASPTYKGAYTGLLKLFLDRFASGAFGGLTAAVPVMLGGDLRHSLAPEVFLKPVLAELGASCPTRGLFLLEADAPALQPSTLGWSSPGPCSPPGQRRSDDVDHRIRAAGAPPCLRHLPHRRGCFGRPGRRPSRKASRSARSPRFPSTLRWCSCASPIPSTTWPALSRAPRLGISVLAAGQTSLPAAERPGHRPL